MSVLLLPFFVTFGVLFIWEKMGHQHLEAEGKARMAVHSVETSIGVGRTQSVNYESSNVPASGDGFGSLGDHEHGAINFLGDDPTEDEIYRRVVDVGRKQEEAVQLGNKRSKVHVPTGIILCNCKAN